MNQKGTMLMNKIFLIFIFLFASNLQAAVFSQSTVSILRGDHFKVGNDRSRTEFTYENLNITEFGDSFFWMDVNSPSAANDDSVRTTGTYGEWSPRISLGKNSGLLSGNGAIQDIFLASTFEFGGNGLYSNLVGIGFNFNISKFQVFQWNFYIRDNLNASGTTTQSTFFYSMPILLIPNHPIVWKAYIDMVHGDEGSSSGGDLVKSHSHTGQQLLMDLNLFNKSKGSLLAGLEYQVWTRKFGIPENVISDTKEFNLKYMMQYIF